MTKDEPMPPVPNRLREIRESANLSVIKLAKILGTSRAQITRLENGSRPLTTTWLQRLAYALRVAPADIISADPDLTLVSDVEPVNPIDLGAHFRALSKRGITFYKVLTDVVNDSGVRIGDIILTERVSESNTAKTGDIILVAAACPNSTAKPVNIMRMYIAPATLTTHRSAANTHLRLDSRDFDMSVIGIVVLDNATS